MAQQLKALAALPEDPSSSQAPTGCLTTIYNSSFRGSDALFWPLWVEGKHVDIHVDKTPIHIK